MNTSLTNRHCNTISAVLSFRKTTILISIILIIFLCSMISPVVSKADRVQVSDQWFHENSDSIGLSYSAQLGVEEETVSGKILGNSGVYVGDVDNHGKPEVLLIGDTQPTLFRNEGGRFYREDTFPELNSKIQSALFVDYSGDGYQDLVFVPKTGRISLFKNYQGLYQLDHRLDTPLIQLGMEITAGDFSGNGCPDLIIVQNQSYHDKTPARKKLFRKGYDIGRLLPREDNGNRNFHLRGNCETYKPVQSKTFKRSHWSFAASAADFTGDGHLDVHVANDFFNDSLYINQGDGSFRHRYLGFDTNRNGMSSTLADFNQDGLPDVFVSNIVLDPELTIFDRRKLSDASSTFEGNNLLLNNGDGQLRDQSAKYSVKGNGWAWGATVGDFNYDGRRELIQALRDYLGSPEAMGNLRYDKIKSEKLISDTGIRRNTVGESLRKNIEDWIAYPAVWTFGDTGDFRRINSRSVGFKPMNARGVAQLDASGDGGLDLIFSQPDQSFQFYENIADSNSGWVTVRVSSPFKGGKLIVHQGSFKRIIPVSVRSDFHSQDTPYYQFALPEPTDTVTVEMVRPNGTRTRLQKIYPGSTVRVP
ncbi:MAG: FG-GAP repeat domain-containing protein [bacterium]